MKNLLNLKNAKILSRSEQKNVFGGLIQNDGCCVFVTYTDGYKYSSCGLSVSEAQGLYGTHYNNLGGSGSADVTGYCCASC